MNFNLLRFGSRKQQDDAQRVMARVLYQRMSAGQTFDHPPRESERVNLALVVIVTPLIDGAPRLELSFFTITKDVSLRGMAFMVNQPLAVDDLLIGIRLPGDSEMTHLRAKVCHQVELGGGFRQVGVELFEIFDTSHMPELRALEP